MIIKNANLYELNEGDRFRVINGEWIGTIRIIDGKYFIENEKRTFELKEDYNHTLDIEILENESTYYNTVGNIIDKADLLKLNDGTIFSIVGEDVVGTVNIVNGKHQVNIGGEILEITEEFNKNVKIKILSSNTTNRCKRMAFV